MEDTHNMGPVIKPLDNIDVSDSWSTLESDMTRYPMKVSGFQQLYKSPAISEHAYELTATRHQTI